MKCTECQEQLSAYLDREVDTATAQVIASHLSTCESCRSELAQLQSLDTRLQSLRIRNAAQYAQTFAERATASIASSSLRSNTHRSNSHFYATITAIAMAACILIAAYVTFWEMPNKRSSPSTAQMVAKLTRTTGSLEVYRKEGKSWEPWGSLQTELRDGDRLRTLEQVICELQTSDRANVRLNEQTEIRMLSGNRVECMSGQVWCRTDSKPMQLLLGSEPSTPSNSGTVSSASAFKDWKLVCPSPSEVQVTVHENTAQCATIEGSATEFRNQQQIYTIQPGSAVDISSTQLEQTASAPVPASNVDKLWQIPLLGLGEQIEDELVAIIESGLAHVGNFKMMSLTESRIRALGPAGAIPLLAYVEQEPAKRDSANRVKAMSLVYSMADTTCADRLRRLTNDSDYEVAQLAQATLKRISNE